MTPRLPLALAVIGLVGAGIVSTSFTAFAQQTPPAKSADTDKPEHRFMPTPEDRAAFLDARLAALHAGLELTADQDKLWPPVEQALRDFSKLVASESQAFHEQGKTLDPVARLQMRSDNMIARGEALKKVAAAAGPLYAALTDAQKHRLPILLHAMHRSHRFAMMEGWRHHMGMGMGIDHPMMHGDDHQDDGEHGDDAQ
ncbi:MAG: Spy/CpxP family protein refolding chaperone [Methylovirgula sp.]